VVEVEVEALAVVVWEVGVAEAEVVEEVLVLEVAVVKLWSVPRKLKREPDVAKGSKPFETSGGMMGSRMK